MRNEPPPFPTAADHPARTRPARWFVFGMGAVFLGLSWLCLNIPKVPPERAFIVAAVLTSIALLLLLVAVVAPVRWAANVAEMWVGASPIQTVLDHELPRDPHARSYFWKTLVALAALIGLVNIAFAMLEVGWTWSFIAVLILTGLWSISLTYREGFSKAKQFASELDEILRENSYETASNDLLKQAASDFKRSFLGDDVSLSFDSAWFKSYEDCVLFWGRYTTSGEHIKTTLCCGMICVLRPEPLSVGRAFERIGSVYCDERSKTLFGTIQAAKDAARASLDSFQWQHYANTIVYRIEPALVHLTRSASPAETRAIIRRTVDEWEIFSRLLWDELEFVVEVPRAP
jgi:hypothetical protein